MRILTRVIWILSLVSLFTDISSEMLYPVMPVYLRHIGFTVLWIGILEGIAEAVTGFSKGYFGNLSDVSGKRVPFVRLGYLLSSISKPMMAMFTYPVWILFARVIDRTGKGVRTGARDAILSDESKPSDRGKVFGFHRGMDTFGAAIGPFAALVFLYFNPQEYESLFYLAFIPAIAGVFLTFLIREKKGENTVREKPGFFEYFRYWKTLSPEYRKLVRGLIIFVLFNSSDVFLLLIGKEVGFSDVELIGSYIFYNLIYALFAYPAGVLADRLGMKIILVSGLLIFSMVYAGMTMIEGKSVFFYGVLFFFYAIYAAATEGIARAWITKTCEKSQSATAIGLYGSLSSIATLLASSIAGSIWFFSKPVNAFFASAIAAFLVAVYLIIFVKERKTNPDD